jgi:hypothetical protein
VNLEPMTLDDTQLEGWSEDDSEAARVLRKAARKIAEGARLIDLCTVINDAGFHSWSTPRLAVAPVEAQEVSVAFKDQCIWFRTGAKNYKGPGIAIPHPGYVNEATTQVPYIPPRIRSLVRPGDLVLWETQPEDWSVERPIPLDPAILRHVAGYLCEVIVTWDLTPLEASAIRAELNRT